MNLANGSVQCMYDRPFTIAVTDIFLPTGGAIGLSCA